MKTYTRPLIPGSDDAKVEPKTWTAAEEAVSLVVEAIRARAPHLGKMRADGANATKIQAGVPITDGIAEKIGAYVQRPIGYFISEINRQGFIALCVLIDEARIATDDDGYVQVGGTVQPRKPGRDFPLLILTIEGVRA